MFERNVLHTCLVRTENDPPDLTIDFSDRSASVRAK